MSARLWTAYEAAAATGGMLCARGGDPHRWVAEEWSADGVSIDSRTLKPGELFVALSDARDGHEFIPAAFKAGASAALVARAPDDSPAGAPLLVVRDTLDALRDLARAARLRNFGVRIAVTGSVGKTSTKEMLRAAFAAAAKAHAADRSFNNHLGVPLTLAQLPADADYSVFEIGMNHAGEITPLVRLVKPHIAIITAIAPAHLENLGSMEAIAEAKSEIFDGVAQGGAAIIPADSPYVDILRARAKARGIGRIVEFGAAPGADVRLVEHRDEGAGARIEFNLFGAAHSRLIGAPGRHQAMNALAVFAAVSLARAPLEPAMQALARLEPAEGRGRRRRLRMPDGRRMTLIDESYNANPASMEAAIALLGATAPHGAGRRIAVLGDMLELGPEAPRLHAELGGPLVRAGVDRLFLAGALMENLWRAAPAAMRARREADAASLAATFADDIKDGDVVMVKGSNASKISAVVKALIESAAPNED